MPGSRPIRRTARAPGTSSRASGNISRKPVSDRSARSSTPKLLILREDVSPRPGASPKCCAASRRPASSNAAHRRVRQSPPRAEPSPFDGVTIVTVPLTALGWTPRLEALFEPHRAAGLLPARVSLEHTHIYRVLTGREEWLARVVGRLRHQASTRTDFPAVGDWVAVEPPDRKSVV